MKQTCWILLVVGLSCSGKPEAMEGQGPLPESDKEVVCFVYHRFGDGRFPSTNISIKDFEAHLRYLKDRHFRVLTLSEAMNYLRSDDPAEKTVVLTIDDGYKSFYENGLPLLKKYAMPATLFINTQTVGAADYMDWTELKAAADSHIEIGNHTHSHSYFLDEPAATRYSMFEKEIAQSQSLIEENLHLSPAVFAYPYGEFDKTMTDIVKKAGFRCAAAQNSGVLYYNTDLFRIPRFPMAEAYADLKAFAEKASMKPLKIVSQSPVDNTLPAGEHRPVLRLTFNHAGLLPGRLQCFTQGSECIVKTTGTTGDRTTITLQASAELSKRRRTLYTVTVPDSAGAWHWYSHLWVNTE